MSTGGGTRGPVQAVSENASAAMASAGDVIKCRSGTLVCGVPSPGVVVAVGSVSVYGPDCGDECALAWAEKDPHVFGLTRIGNVFAVPQLKTRDYDRDG